MTVKGLSGSYVSRSFLSRLELLRSEASILRCSPLSTSLSKYSEWKPELSTVTAAQGVNT